MCITETVVLKNTYRSTALECVYSLLLQYYVLMIQLPCELHLYIGIEMHEWLITRCA